MVKQNAQMMGHNIIGGYLGGPATFVIDPATIGDNTGTVQIKGNLQVDGTNTTINSATLTVDDKNIVIASGAANAAAADGAGITVDGASATLTYTASNDRFAFNKELTVARVHGNVTGNVTGTVSDISNHSTTNLSEGTNLYFTNTRADARIALQVGANLDLSSKDTDALSEGSTNLYFTNARADTRATLRITAADIGNLNNVDETGVANNKILKYNSTSSKWEVADEATPGIANLVEDTTPQLGGTLDTNGQLVQFGDSSGSTVNRLTFGAGSDLSIYHDGNHSYIADSGTGNLRITSNYINIYGAGGVSATFYPGNSVSLYHNNVKKFETTSTGIEVTGSTTSETLISTIATGTAPLTVASTTMVSNLNADKLDDKEFTDIIAEATALAIALG